MRRPQKVLLLGAGGMGMVPLALYLRGAGVRVEAFDDRFTEPLRSHLIDQGVKVLDELNPIKTPECIVYSSAISRDDDRLNKFKKDGLPLYRRGDFLAALFSRHKIIAVVGSHGKTSVSGRLSWALQQVGFEASHLVGAQFKNFALPSGFYSKSKWVVMEVDESDGSIDHFSPWMTVCLNCDWDHVDQYADSLSFADTLTSLFQRTQEAVVHSDSPSLITLLSSQKNKRTYSFESAKKPAYFLDANNRAVLVAAKALGLNLSEIDFEKFPGMERRQSLLFDSSTRVILEDYAHHPSEIASLLGLRRSLLPEHQMRVVFQPHRYSRTKVFAAQFAEELSLADELHLLPTYGAFETFDPSGEAESLSGYLPPRLRDSTTIFKNFYDLKTVLTPKANQSPDQIIFLGAGDLTKWAHAYCAWEKAQGVKQDAFGLFLKNRLGRDSKLVRDMPLGSMTTMGVGGAATWYAEPANLSDLSTLVESCDLFDLQRAMIGRGSNLLIPDQGFGGLVIRLKGDFWRTIDLRTDDTIIVGAGAKLKEICKFACLKNLKGFEFLEGIPGTLGGALRMNAGAMGWEIFDLVEWVKFLMPNGEIKQIEGDELEVGYRYCREAYEGIALRAKLKAEGRAQHLEIRKLIDKMSRKRRQSQPKQASSGCVFRNPESHPAGWLIEQAGLKGEKVGGAAVSDIHGNFIINNGDATTEQVVELIQRVKERVKQTHGVILEPEVNLLGQSWNQYLS
jgi:UDP-N-acetylmuramate--alanine ligase